MAYKVLSLKWRPQIFSDIVGQEHVTKTLVNAFKKDRVAHGYIFSGPRGVGKTTTARILSKGLNSEGGPRFDFDPSSSLAEEISQGRALDVLEIDGASNRGIEEIRNLREQIKFAPMVGQYKVIIIDEVHMLTNPAFNALLRTLEEPPEHGKFIFCTTDIHKVPATIISRCQRFDFNRIATDVIIDRISFILNNEKIKSDKDSLQIIARKADGSMRDALSILDQVISYCGTEIVYNQTVVALGAIPNDLYFSYTESLIKSDGSLLLKTLEKFSQYGVQASEVINGINMHIKNLLYAKIGAGVDLLDMNQESKKLYLQHSDKWDNRDLLRIIQVLSDVSSYINRSDDPYLILEFTSLKLLEMDKSISLDKLLEEVNLSDIFSSAETRQNKNLSLKDNNDKSNRDKSILINKSINQKIGSDLDNIDKKRHTDKKPNNKNIVVLKKNDLSIKDIKDGWQGFIDKVHIKKPSIASILDKSVPHDIIDKSIKIRTSNVLDFHLNMVEKNTDIINEILSSKFGEGTKFTIENNIETNAMILDEKKDGQTDNSERNEQVRDKVIDLFDGEILT